MKIASSEEIAARNRKSAIARRMNQSKVNNRLIKALLEAWDELERDGKSLGEVAKKEPKWFYEKFVAPLIPRSVNFSGEVGMQVVLNVVGSGSSLEGAVLNDGSGVVDVEGGEVGGLGGEVDSDTLSGSVRRVLLGSIVDEGELV